MYLDRLCFNNYKIIVSSDYNDIILQLVEYKKCLKYKCRYCIRYFYSSESRDTHHKHFHKNYNI